MKKNKLSIERINELMNVFDWEVACSLQERNGIDFGAFQCLLYSPEFISVNHILYFDMMLDPFKRFKEFDGILSHYYFSDDEEVQALIAPDSVDMSDYTSNNDIPEEIKCQLRPLNRDDVLDIVEKIKNVFMELSSRLQNHVIWDLEDEGLTPEDVEKQYGLGCLEHVIDQSMTNYFNSYGDYIVLDENIFNYLYDRWLNEDPNNYKALEEYYLKEIEEQNKKEEAYTNQLLEWEKHFVDRMRCAPEMEETDEEIEAEVGFNIAYYNYLRDHVFHFIKE